MQVRMQWRKFRNQLNPSAFEQKVDELRSGPKLSIQAFILEVQATSSSPCWINFTKDFPYLQF